ncbi:PUB domain [Trypanosoma melophagium]|uniref:PUB domain n=1 Tax=Trypanosoma melophagium TaxID=715481 RepID=UPI00351A85FF|nr:PUB domain [Trypanosoma melophagium]
MSASLVQLYCYDISGGMAASMSLMLIGRHIDSIWHTAIVVYGKEFYFDGGTGIVYETPGRTRFGAPKRVEVLGTTNKTEAEFLAWTHQQRHRGFGPNDYSLLHRNCNHFTQVAAQFLLGCDIPDDIRNMIPTLLETPLGAMLRPMLESITTAPGTGNINSSGEEQTAVVSSTPTMPPTGETKCIGLLSTKSEFTTEDEDDLMLACAMLQSNELLSTGTRGGFDLTLGALTQIRNAILNILQNPSESKYRGLSTSSKSYTENLLPLEGFGLIEVLRLCGFRLRQHPSGIGQQWYLSDADGNEDLLTIMVFRLNELIEAIQAEAPSQTSKEVNTIQKESHKTEEFCSQSIVENVGIEGSMLEVMLHNAGKPISSLDELLLWSSDKPGPITPAVSCKSRVSKPHENYPRLLVCHDMCGGYLPGDYPHFALCDSTSVTPVVDVSYTINYWHLVDYFVYFSHHRVSIPPKEWINAGHREGVPVLGTFLSEGDAWDLRIMLHSAKEMGKVISKLVELCNAYNFDGYLINIESDVDQVLAGRLVTFTSLLRQTLNKRRPDSSCERVVIWYDAVTMDGSVHYQNSLSVKNKPFFDAASGLFTNYGWSPLLLAASEALAGSRARNVYAGVDVFGRSGMYGGGGYNSHVAVGCVAAARLSVALFAPGWTLEHEGRKQRETFVRANARMWSKMQDFFHAKHLVYETLPVWTCFRSGVGKQFYVNGECVVGGGDASCVEWCQLSQTQFNPSYQFSYEESAPSAWCMLSVEQIKEKGKDNKKDSIIVTKQHGMVPVEWKSETAWMGDRSMSFNVPCQSSVILVRWKINISELISKSDCGNKPLAFLDIAWHRDSQTRHVRRVRVEGLCDDSTSQLMFTEDSNNDTTMRTLTVVGDWEIVRCVIPSHIKWSHLTCVALLNTSTDTPMHCTVGGIGITLASNNTNNNNESVLMAGVAISLSTGMYHVHRVKKQPTIQLIQMEMPENILQWENVLLFAKVSNESGKSACVYMGQHEVKSTMWVQLNVPTTAVVQEICVRRIASIS